MLYGSECWALKRKHEHKMEVAEMRMLRWMCGHTIKERIYHDHIRERVEVTSNEPVRIVDQMVWSPYKRERETKENF